MEAWLEFARGPLFRFTFGLCLLGLLRNIVLAVWSIGRAYHKAGDKQLPWALIRQRTIRWLFPFQLSRKNRFFYSICSILFHIGLILVPIFLFAHLRLWESAFGIGWLTRFALPKLFADILTVTTIITAMILFFGRVGSSASRVISSTQDILWPILLMLPFISGLLCAYPTFDPLNYHTMMLIHILSAELIFVLLPFTKIAHCVLVPFSHLVSELGWRFPRTAGRDVDITLGKQGQPL